MIPPFDERGQLPPGEPYEAAWGEIVERLTWTKQRQFLLERLLVVLVELRAYGCRWFYLDGSFVSDKDEPGDWDGCWEMEGVNAVLLNEINPALYGDRLWRSRFREQYHGDIFRVRAGGYRSDQKSMLLYFQQDRNGNPKGILKIDLETVPWL